MTDLTDNVTEVIKIIVDATSDAVVKKMKPVVEKMTCEDAISRQAVLDIYCPYCGKEIEIEADKESKV